MDLKKKRKNLIYALLYVAAILLVLILIAAVSGFIYGWYTLDRNANQIPEWFTMDLLSQILYVPISGAFTILFLHKTRYRTEMKAALHIEVRRWLFYALLFGILVQMAEYALLSNLSADYYHFTSNDTFNEVLEDVLKPESLLLFVSACISGSVVEELLCRFFFPLHFRQAYSQKIAVLFSALIFSILHFPNSVLLIPFYVVDSFLLYLIYSRTGSIWCAIFMHFGMNFYTLIVRYVEFGYVNVSIPFLMITACFVLFAVITLVRKPNLLAKNSDTVQPEQ